MFGCKHRLQVQWKQILSWWFVPLVGQQLDSQEVFSFSPGVGDFYFYQWLINSNAGWWVTFGKSVIIPTPETTVVMSGDQQIIDTWSVQKTQTFREERGMLMHQNVDATVQTPDVHAITPINMYMWHVLVIPNIDDNIHESFLHLVAWFF